MFNEFLWLLYFEFPGIKKIWKNMQILWKIKLNKAYEVFFDFVNAATFFGVFILFFKYYHKKRSSFFYGKTK